MEKRLVISYDITDNKLRTQIHKFLSQYGVNIQKSVFELLAGEIELRKIIQYLVIHVPKDYSDSVRIYELCRNCQRNISKLGEGIDLHLLDFQII